MKFSKTCSKCLDIANAKAAEKRAGLPAGKHERSTDKGNVESTQSSSDDCQKGKSVAKHPPNLTWDEFLLLLAENKDHPFELEAFVKINRDLLTAVKSVESTHDRAVGIANAVKEATGFRFKYVLYLQGINNHARN
jgi:hypothetical protein